MGAGLLDLSEEILEMIVDQIEHRKNSHRGFLSARLSCRSLERVCHNRFLQCIAEQKIELDLKHSVSRLVAISASPVHAPAIKKILFAYSQERINLQWAVPLLSDAFTNLRSMNRSVIIGIDPFADHHGMQEERVVEYLDKILLIAAASRIKVTSIHVQARRQDWDPSFEPVRRDTYTPYVEGPHVDFGCILESIHHNIQDDHEDGSGYIVQSLVADFPGIGYVYYDFQKRSLKFKGTIQYHCDQLYDWISGVKAEGIRFDDCHLDPRALGSYLQGVEWDSVFVSRLSIINSRLNYDADTNSDRLSEADINDLLESIEKFGADLEYCHLESIWGAVERPEEYPAFRGDNIFKMSGIHEIREGLKVLRGQFEVESAPFDEGMVAREDPPELAWSESEDE